jgi:hypothetical protein
MPGHTSPLLEGLREALQSVLQGAPEPGHVNRLVAIYAEAGKRAQPKKDIPGGSNESVTAWRGRFVVPREEDLGPRVRVDTTFVQRFFLQIASYPGDNRDGYSNRTPGICHNEHDTPGGSCLESCEGALRHIPGYPGSLQRKGRSPGRLFAGLLNLTKAEQLPRRYPFRFPPRRKRHFGRRIGPPLKVTVKPDLMFPRMEYGYPIARLDGHDVTPLFVVDTSGRRPITEECLSGLEFNAERDSAVPVDL